MSKLDYSAVKAVVPLGDYVLSLVFENGEEGLLDLKLILNFGVFTRLKDYQSFQRVRVAFDTIEWDCGVDLDPEYVYSHCKLQPDSIATPYPEAEITLLDLRGALKGGSADDFSKERARAKEAVSKG